MVTRAVCLADMAEGGNGLTACIIWPENGFAGGQGDLEEASLALVSLRGVPGPGRPCTVLNHLEAAPVPREGLPQTCFHWPGPFHQPSRD